MNTIQWIAPDPSKYLIAISSNDKALYSREVVCISSRVDGMTTHSYNFGQCPQQEEKNTIISIKNTENNFAKQNVDRI
jgi:hypothetical protein